MKCSSQRCKPDVFSGYKYHQDSKWALPDQYVSDRRGRHHSFSFTQTLLLFHPPLSPKVTCVSQTKSPHWQTRRSNLKLVCFALCNFAINARVVLWSNRVLHSLPSRALYSCKEQGVGLNDPYGCLPTQAILWFETFSCVAAYKSITEMQLFKVWFLSFCH